MLAVFRLSVKGLGALVAVACRLEMCFDCMGLGILASVGFPCRHGSSFDPTV